MIACFVLVIVSKTLLFTSRQTILLPPSASEAHKLQQQFTEKDSSELLSGAIKFKTVSNTQSTDNAGEFIAFNHYIERNFPSVLRTLEKVQTGNHSLLFIWKGKQADLKPLMFITHSDVVGISSHQRDKWKHNAFSGHVDENFIWGRGALDNKANITAQLAAVEHLTEAGFQPKKTILFLIGEDEEIGGNNGAKNAQAYLAKKDLLPDIIIDEGGLISENIVPFVSRPVALVGIAEKAYLTVQLTVQQDGGHASMPPESTAIGVLAAALSKLESNQMPLKMSPPVRKMFEYLGPEMPVLPKMMFANLWLFNNTLLNKLAKTPSTNASVRSTMAITEISGGIAENVLPNVASATVNVRLLPGESVNDALEHIRKVIANPDIKLYTTPDSHEASAISNTDSTHFSAIHQTIKKVYPDIYIAPYLTITASDSRHFPQTENIFRFSPYRATSDDLKRIHGLNERIARKDFNNMIVFYRTLISLY